MGALCIAHPCVSGPTEPLVFLGDDLKVGLVRGHGFQVCQTIIRGAIIDGNDL